MIFPISGISNVSFLDPLTYLQGSWVSTIESLCPKFVFQSRYWLAITCHCLHMPHRLLHLISMRRDALIISHKMDSLQTMESRPLLDFGIHHIQWITHPRLCLSTFSRHRFIRLLPTQRHLRLFIQKMDVSTHQHPKGLTFPWPNIKETLFSELIYLTSTAAEPFIQPLRTSNFQPTPNLQPTSAVNYIHINFIRDSIRPHRDRYTGRDRNNLIPFTLTKVATYMRMEDLILIMGHGDLSGMTECKKSTDGRSWSEVQTFQIGDDKSNKSLQDLGWTGSKGTAESPIWVCVYRPDLEEEEERIYWERLGFPAEWELWNRGGEGWLINMYGMS